jgi:hypothetical protein
VFFHPEHLQDARLTYLQKTYVARAYAELTNNAKEWQLMVLLNSLRNEVAHGGTERQRTDKIGEMRKIISGMGNVAFQAKVKSSDDKALIVLIYAAALCSGFLLIREEELTEIRRPA